MELQMMTCMRIAILPVITVLLLSSCAPSVLGFTAYDLENGGTLRGQYLYDGSGSGTMTLVGRVDRLEGQYTTIRSGAGAWGTIYGRYYSVSVESTAQRGAAVMTSVYGTRWTMECEYIVSRGVGHGVCRDNRGLFYRVMF